MRTLKRPYLQIELENGYSYGGNQQWFERNYLKKSACGVIGAADLILYLMDRTRITDTRYMEFAKMLCRQYLPVIPGFGMNGLTLVLGLNRYFSRQGLPYRTYWNVSGRKLLCRIDELLSKDLPVILSIGPNFPNFLGKRKVNFYRKTNEGSYCLAAKTKAHYVTVTGRDGLWLQISSWGKEYFINYKEYEDYVINNSSFLISNIVCIKTIKKIK